MKLEQTFSSFESPNVFQVTQEMIFFLPGISAGLGIIGSFNQSLENESIISLIANSWQEISFSDSSGDIFNSSGSFITIQNSAVTSS